MPDIEDEKVILPLSSLKKPENKDEGRGGPVQGPEEIHSLRSV